MRANLVALGSHGDVLPFVGLGSELRRRGFDVTLATADPFRTLAEREGLAFHSLATTDEFEQLIANAALWRPIRGARAMLKAAMTLLRPTYSFVTSAFDPRGTVTVASTIAFGARVAQERYGLPLATVHLAPLFLRSGHDAPRMPGLPAAVRHLPPRVRTAVIEGADALVLDPLCRPLLAFRKELGLPPIRGVMSWWVHSPDRVIAAFPSWYAKPQPDWPSQVRQVAFPQVDHLGSSGGLDSDLARFLASGPKPVAVTFGSAMIHDERLVATSVEACGRLGLRAVVVSPVRRSGSSWLQGQVIQSTYAPFGALFPHCAAVVHHGGVGTTASALRAGIPQLVVPLAFDHFDEAARLERLGVGTALRRWRFKAGSAGRRLHQLLTSPAVTRACATASARMQDTDGIADACNLVARLAHPNGDA